MVSISATQAVAILAFLTNTVRGHMILGSPVPFDFPDESNKQAPLDATGSNFPCKFPAGFQPVQHTKNKPMAPGSTDNELSFIGGATHGGGSCQVSLTTDTAPTKDSKWEVIHSIEGGCPSDAPENLSNDASDTASSKFKYAIPADLAAGKYTLAWTWFNKIGNREMYMNCAPVEIAGGAAKREVNKVNKKRQSARPDIMRANIGNGCSTAPSKDVTFPNPGDSLEKGGAVDPAEPVGGPACGPAGAAPAAGASSSSGTGSTGSGSDPAAGAAAGAEASAPAASATASAPAASAPAADPTAAPVAAASATASAPAASAPAADPAAAPVASAPAADPAAAAPAAGAPAAGAACSPEGTFVCAPDGTSFTRCASGVTSAPIAMSAGTKCVPGQDPQNLKVVAVKRSVRFGAEHAARSF